MKIAIVGATGLVGSTMLKVLEEKNFPVTELIPVATQKSIGKPIGFQNRNWPVVSMQEAVIAKPDIAIFSAGSGPSLEWAPKFAANKTYVIDNSSAWRMQDHIPLIVPEINADVLKQGDYIIANPNCSTIQMVMVLNPLHLKYSLKRVVVSTYQSVSGAGAKGVNQMMNEREGKQNNEAFAYPIDMNALPQIDSFLENGYTKEEMKMVNETRKILRAPNVQVTSTCVRIPVKGGHSESVNAEFALSFELADVKQILNSTEGVIVQDNIDEKIYPMPLNCEGKDEVFVGRIRIDESQPNTLNCWIVSDNLRKGAATNAVQIAEQLRKKFFN